MYNLIIGYSSSEVGADRMLEHTSAVVKEYVAPASSPDNPRGTLRPERLLNLPALMLPETGFDDLPQLARVGHVSNLTLSGRNYTFSFTPNPAIEPIPSALIEAAGPALGITSWEFQRTHWAVKDVDLYRVLDEHVISHRPKPKVLRFPTEQLREPDLVAVMMPFDAAFEPAYMAIKAGVEAAGLRCLRADDIWERDHIIDDVLSLIWRARVIVADLTGKNPNVFYEAGIAHTLGRDVILATQSLNDVPFDLRSIRALAYHNNGEGRTSLSESVQARLQTLTAEPL